MKNQNFSVRQILAGIHADDARIINHFHQRLFARAQATLCRHLLPGSCQQLAFEDCFSKAFLTILKKVREGSYVDGNFWAFSIGVVKYSHKGEWRKGWRHNTAALEDMLEIPAPEMQRCPDAETWFDQVDHPQLWDWFAHLDHPARILLDYRIQGYQHDEIAPLVNLAPGTVRNNTSALLRHAKTIVGEGRKSAA